MFGPSTRPFDPDDLLERARRTGVRAPDFGPDRTWLNVARPLSLAGDLRGKLVLLDFWTYCCINCLHVLPDLHELEARYADEPFVVVGVHAPKFANERDPEQVRMAVVRHGVAHPVVLDPDMEIWSRYAVRAWPTLVLVDPEGRIVLHVAGEGHREVLDAVVAAALRRYRDVLDPTPLPLRPEAPGVRAGASLAFPGKVAAAEGCVWIADSVHHRLVQCTPRGEVLRTLGSGERGLADGPAERATFAFPQGMAPRGNGLFVADTDHHAVRCVDLASGEVRTVAGTGEQGFSLQGRGPARRTALSSPWDVAWVGEHLWIALAGCHQIVAWDPVSDTVAPVAGDGTEQRRDGPLRAAAFAQPSGLAVQGEHVYVADSESSSVRQVDLRAGEVRTLAGGDPHPMDLFTFGDEDGRGFGPRFQHPLGVACHGGRVYVADTYNHKIKTVDPSSREVRTLAGTGARGFEDGPAVQARFNEPSGLMVFEEALWIADTNNHAVRRLCLRRGVVETMALHG